MLLKSNGKTQTTVKEVFLGDTKVPITLLKLGGCALVCPILLLIS